MTDLGRHVAGDYIAHKHKYIIPDKIDGEVVARQSRKQIKEDKKLTIIVHHHASTDKCPEFEHDAYGTSLASAKVTQPQAV